MTWSTGSSRRARASGGPGHRLAALHPLAPVRRRSSAARRLSFHQAYPGRGGDLDCELVGDRVLLRGAAVTVLEGVLRIW